MVTTTKTAEAPKTTERALWADMMETVRRFNLERTPEADATNRAATARWLDFVHGVTP